MYHFTLADGTRGMDKILPLKCVFPELFFRGKEGDLRERGGLSGGGSVMRNTPLWYVPEKMRCVC